MRSTSPASSSGCCTRARAPQTSAAACRAAGEAARSPSRGPSWSSADTGSGAGTTVWTGVSSAACDVGMRASISATSSATPQAASATIACPWRMAAADPGSRTASAGLDGGQFALERDAGVDGVAIEQVVRVVAQAGAGEVGHAAVEPPRGGDGGAQLGHGDLRGRRRGGGGGGRFERAGAGDERLEIVGGAIAPDADVLAGRGVGAFHGAEVEHRGAAVGEGGRRSPRHRRIARRDRGRVARSATRRRRESDRGRGGESAGRCGQASKYRRRYYSAIVKEMASCPGRRPGHVPDAVPDRTNDQKLNCRRDHQRTAWRGWSSPIGRTRLLCRRSAGVTK